MLVWALGAIFVLFLILAYIIIQGTRAALAWREAATRGDVTVIRDIVEDALKTWSSQKRPKPVPPEVWRGIQSMQLVDVAADYVRVSLSAESDYRLEDGHWVEIRNPLQEGISMTARAADMLLYELVHFRPDEVQIDVNTQYRDHAGVSRRECILSTRTTREHAKSVDWEEWTADEIVRALDGAYRLSDAGRPLPIEPYERPKTPDDVPAPAAEATS
jgi:hypothetical protein